MQVLQRPQVILPGIGWDEPWAILDAVRSAIEIALRCLPPQSEAWAEILRRYLPSDPPGSIFSRRGNEKFILLHAYALESALRGHRVDLDAIISDIRLQKSGGGRTYDTELFRSEAGGVLPWFSLSAEIACGRSPSDISNAIQSALGEATRANRHGYENLRIICPQVASELLRIICAVEDVPKGQLDSLKSWLSEHERHLPVDTLITLCRYAARRHGFEHLAMDFCVRAYSALDASREAADSQADSFVRLARAILTVSAEEARAYFNRAVEIANRIGDENIDRLFALLNLATAASEGGVPRPRTAYRLSRTAELKKRYVERDKHFPWDMTMEVLVDLCPTSALAILSRWRDRRFGPSERLLPIVVGRLVGKRLLPESTPIVFAGIDAYWERVLDLKRALAAENNPQTERASPELLIATFVYPQPTPRSGRPSKNSAAFTTLICQISNACRVQQASIIVKPRELFWNSAQTTPVSRHPRRPDWNVILQNANLCDASTLLSLYFELYKYDPPYDHEVFFREALSRVKPGRESDFIRAIATWPDFTYLNLRELLRALPSPIPNQLALRTAIKDLVLSTCRREPHRIQKVGWLDESLLEVLSLGGIIAHRDIATAALEGVSAQAEILDASKIFKSLGPIALLLSPAQADEVLDFGFSLLDEILKPEDGDGVWRESLQPHGTVVDALAGYIWVGLGSAVASERWQYAHVVRAIAELGWTELLTAVVAMADADCSEFTDQQLLFYGWHARQWLLIGITRTAIDNPTALGPAHAFLERSLKFDHIIIRDLAAQALRALTAAGEYHATTIGDLTVNHPKNTLVYSGFMKRNDEQTEPSTDAERNDSHHFWPDIGPYWFEPLGRAFGLNQKDIERRAMTVIRRELGWSGGFDWREDRRRARNLFDETETSHGHGSLPKTDDLLTYLAYHAMMHVSADLLEERPALRNVEDHITEFDDWMKQYMLTRSDGRWLADWRTPRIITTDSGSARYEKAWRWGVDARYLDQQLMTDDGMRVLGANGRTVTAIVMKQFLSVARSCP